MRSMSCRASGLALGERERGVAPAGAQELVLARHHAPVRLEVALHVLQERGRVRRDGEAAQPLEVLGGPRGALAPEGGVAAIAQDEVAGLDTRQRLQAVADGAAHADRRHGLRRHLAVGRDQPPDRVQAQRAHAAEDDDHEHAREKDL
jgi:hypothetical protein